MRIGNQYIIKKLFGALLKLQFTALDRHGPKHCSTPSFFTEFKLQTLRWTEFQKTFQIPYGHNKKGLKDAKITKLWRLFFFPN